MKKKLKKAYDGTIKYIKKVKKEHLIKKYINDNPLFLIYIIINVLNSTLLRFFTINTLQNYLSIKPIIADLAVIIIAGSLGFLFKNKGKFRYWMSLTAIFTATCIINSVYYTFYTSFASISMLSLTQFLGPVGDAVVQNVVQLKDLTYLIAPLIFIFANYKLKKKGYYKKVELNQNRKQNALKSLVVGIILAVGFIISLTSLEIGRFTKQWNKEYIVMRFGIYVYQLNDGVTSLKPKINSMFGLGQALKDFEEFYEDRKENDQYASGTNEFTNILKGKNVLVIHAESLQTIAMNTKFNDQEVTPNLNKLAREGIYFSNYYSQVSVGTSSDAELTFTTSLMPTQSGTAFVSYFDRTYIGLPKLMQDNGYYTFSMHGNNADFWNRRVMHENLGYQKFYSKKDYNVTSENTIGLGISDKAFFEQSVEKIAKIAAKNEKYYGQLITLTNHTPFADVDKYGEFDVNIKETTTSEDGTTSEVVYPYMEGTKLGNYFKSVHYADSALQEFIDKLDEKGLLENTVIVLYGDHDARLPEKDYRRLFNYDKETDSTKSKDDPEYVEFDSYQYELNRKVPFIIWTKDKEYNKEISDVMGMYDAMPTLANMLGIKRSEYALGHDIFNIKEDNIVIFPNGNWLTNKVYYNSQKNEYLSLNSNETISNDYIDKNTKYTNKLLDISNNLIVYDLIARQNESKEKVLTKNTKEGS